jgi:DNA-binding GntR family transcriptional regulator
MAPKGPKSKKVIVYESLKRRIITNTLPPGEPLNEGVLSKELKTSKTPIREAMQQLEREGFIENFPGKGAFVSRISVEDILEFFEIREILECEVIRRVAAKEDLNVAEAEAVRRRFESSEADGNKTARSSFKPGDQIHTFVFEAFGNKRLLEYYRRLQEHIERMRLYFFSQLRPERSEQSSLEHLEIVNALIARDPQRAEEAMRVHLRNATDYLKRII